MNLLDCGQGNLNLSKHLKQEVASFRVYGLRWENMIGDFLILLPNPKNGETDL